MTKNLITSERLKDRMKPLLGTGALIVALLAAGCSKSPPYIGSWSGDTKDSHASLTMKEDGTFIVLLNEPGDAALSAGDFHMGTYKVASSNAETIKFTIDVQSKLHQDNPTADAGLAGGTLRYYKDISNGKESFTYTYDHKSGRSKSFYLQRD